MSEMNKQLEPKIRFEGFSEDWYKSQLGRLGDFKNGLNKDKEEFGFGIPFVNLMDVFGVNSLSSSANLSLVNANETEQKTYELLESDVLFIRSSVKATGVGLTAVILRNLEKTVYSGFLIRFREKSQKLDTSFKRYCFGSNHFRKRLLAVSTSSANTNVNQQELSRLCLKYPKIQEQTQIGNFFQQLDKLIELQTRALESAEIYKKAMLQKMFPQKGEKVPRVRFAGFSGDWEEKKVGDVSDSYSGGTPSVDNRNYYNNGNIPFIRSGEISKDKTELFITELGLENSSAKLVDKGDILYALYGATSGEVARSQIKGAINQAILAISPHEKYDPEYLTQTLSFHKELILSVFLQGGQGNLSGTLIKSLKLLFPSYEEQTAIGNFFQKLDQQIEQQAQKLATYQQLKKAMLQRMFV